MENKFLDLVSSPLMNLDHTYRYSGTKLVEAESLSQHIVDTIMLGLKMIDAINGIANYTCLDPSKYVMKAIYHDLEEVVTGDVPRPLKYYDDATRDSLKNVADQVARKFFDEQFNYGITHYNIWNDAKEDAEGYILKIVDTLVVANKVIKEVTLLHNFYVLRVAHEVSQYLRELRDTVAKRDMLNDEDITDYLTSILDGAIKSMDDIINANKDCMDALNIYGQSMI